MSPGFCPRKKYPPDFVLDKMSLKVNVLDENLP
jgi:hypothetical protein